MFQPETYEEILRRNLSRVDSNIDKRQGSIIYDAIAPMALELAEVYAELNNVLKLTFAETSFDEFLDMRTSEMGVHRRQATKAKRLGIMEGANSTLIDVPIGSRFGVENEVLNYVVLERIELGKYILECETAGTIGNHFFGRLIPINHVRDLTRAELYDVLIPGENTETDESLYKRYEETVNTTPFGGNIDDYRRVTNAMDGVGDCKIIPIWNGGGTVKVVVIDSQYGSPSNELIRNVQEMLDPVPYGGMGLGLAPIGHVVTVEGIENVSVKIESKLILRAGTSLGQVEDEIKESLEQHFLDLRKAWGEDTVSVRVSIINSIILQVRGVVDVEETLLNGESKNVVLDNNEVPILGELVLGA